MTALSWLQKMRRANWRGGFERTAVHAAMPTQRLRNRGASRIRKGSDRAMISVRPPSPSDYSPEMNIRAEVAPI